MRNESNLARWACWGILAVAGLAAVPSNSRAQTAQTRIAYINFRDVIQADPAYAKAESTFRTEMEGMQKGVERLQQQFDSSMSEYTKQSVILSPSAKQAKEKQLQTLQQQLQQRAQDFQGQVQKREQELMQPIEERVRAVVEGVRAERNISVIFDVSGQGNSIVAADKSLDITPTVLQRIRPGS